MARKEIKGPINDNTLNNTNHNFKELYDEFGNVVKTVSDKAFDKVVDSAKLNWKEPVSSQSNLPDDADEGDTRMARDTGKVYRFDWYSWKEIQEIDAGPVNEVDTRLTSQLADAAKQKADKTEVQTGLNSKRDKNVPIGLNDASPELLEAIEGGEGTSFNLLSIPRDNSVTYEKTTFIEASTNLINTKSLIPGYTISGTTGQLEVNSVHSVTDFMEVVPNAPYITSKVARRAFYDIDKEFISSAVGNTAFQTPSNAYYARWVVHNDNLKTVQLNKGNVLLAHEPYYVNFKQELNPLRIGSVKNDHIEDNTVGIDKLNFIKRSTNLFNNNDVMRGYAIDTVTGEPVPNSANSLSAFIEVSPNQVYQRKHVNRIGYYDSEKKFISSTANPSNSTTPSNCFYVRLAVSTSYLDVAQFNKGDVLLDYEDYYVYLSGVGIEPKKNEDVISGNNDYVQRLYTNEVYTAPLLPDVSISSPSNFKELLYSDINNLFDELAINYPDYVTKELLGVEATGREIYRFDFKPPRTNQSGVKVPKIFITAGTHGSEKTGVWVAYQSVKQMCEAWDSQESLENLRWNVHLIVIPILNPWGWDYITVASGNRTGTRKNSNGVDIARNFPTGWVLGSDTSAATYGGTAPLSEPEAQYANAIIEAEKNNLIYVCDFHNFFRRGIAIWNAAATNFQINLGEHLVRHMSRKWKKEHSDMAPQDETTLVGYSDMGAPNGSIGKHATSFGIHGSTFEVSEYNPWDGLVGNSPLTIKFGMDAFVNWLNLVVKNSITHLK